MPVPRVIDLVAETQITRNSSPLDISEEIQRAADSSVLLLRQAAEYRSEELEGYLDASFMKSQRESDSQSSAGVASSGHSDPEQPQSWSQLATALSAAGAGDTAQTTQNAENHDDTQAGESDPMRLERPERIARPNLPPVQRIRPLQRTGVLPPRIRPMPL